MRIASVGAGNVGMALGHGWARHGYEISPGVRNPVAEEVLVGTATPGADAVRDAKVVVPATPWAGVEKALAASLVAGSITALDATPVDAGGVEAARDLEPVAVLGFRVAYRPGNGPNFGVHLLRR